MPVDVIKLIMEDEFKSVICRACLKNDSADETTLPLFEKNKDSFIYEKLLAVADVDVKPGDSFPSTICMKCWLELETAYTFKQKCERSNAILHSSLQDNSIVSINSDIKDETNECDGEFEYEYLEDDKLFWNESEQIKIELPELIDESTNESADHKSEPSDLKIAYSDTEQNTNVKKQSRAIDLHLECNECGGFFKSKCKLKVHWKNVHLQEQLVCKICKRQFKSFKTYNIHVKSKPETCRVAIHYNIEGEGRSRVFTCKSCKYSSKNLKSLISHARTHTGERPYACQLCDKSFAQISSLISHKEHIHKIINKEGSCPDCGIFLQGRIKLTRHIRRYHSDKRYPCNICGKELKTTDSLKVHLLRHTGVKNYACEFCSKTFVSSSGLTAHKILVHYKSRLYDCNKCKYTSRHYARMKTHKSKHTGTNVSCEICGAFLENSLQLELHKNRHIKTLECIECNKMFYSSKSLLTHKRQKHKIYQALKRPSV